MKGVLKTFHLSAQLDTKQCMIAHISILGVKVWLFDLDGLFSEGGEVIKIYIEGSLMIPTTGIKRV